MNAIHYNTPQTAKIKVQNNIPLINSERSTSMQIQQQTGCPKTEWSFSAVVQLRVN